MVAKQFRWSSNQPFQAGSFLTVKALAALVCACYVAVPGATAQTTLPVPETACSFAGETLPGQLMITPGDDTLNKAVAAIVGYTGLSANFSVRSSNVPDAVAITVGDEHYILYNHELMDQLMQATKTQYSVVAVLAHEVGHHLLGHTLKPGGSRPKEELEADHYSGFILEKMGVPVEAASAAVSALTTDIPTATHPPRSLRLASVISGWWYAYQLEHHPPDLGFKVSLDPVPQATWSGVAPSGADVQYVGRPVLYGQQNPVFLTTSALVGLNALGQAVIVGRKLPPTSPGYAWMYAGPSGTFGVDEQGRMWSLEANRVQVGYVAGLK